MTERPILMSSPMVRAILEDRKTVTRRIVKPQPLGTTETIRLAADLHGFFGIRCPYGTIGNRLWVRETWRWFGRHRNEHLEGGFEYRSDLRQRRFTEFDNPDYRWSQFLEQSGKPNPWRWHPSIHMPRWACRLVMEITGVRVERLQDITEEGARAEGFARREHFIRLWDELNAKRGYGFDLDPWVWVISFRKVNTK